jgi:membrane protease YdiL (CAAX protease family)
MPPPDAAAAGASPSSSAGAPLLRPAPGRRETFLVLGLVFVLNLAFGFAFVLAGLRASLVLTQALAFALPPLAALRLFYLDGRSVLPFRRPAPRHLAAAVLGTLGLNHLLTIYAAWQERFWPQPDSLRTLFESLLSYQGPLDFAWLLAAVAIVPAICEEILFRGFVQSGLVRQSEAAWSGIAATALIFGVFHLDPWRFVMVSLLGLFLGWLRHASGSLWPAILAHALNNALSVALIAAGTAAVDRAPGNVVTGACAAGLVLLALVLGRARPGKGPGRML